MVSLLGLRPGAAAVVGVLADGRCVATVGCWLGVVAGGTARSTGEEARAAQPGLQGRNVSDSSSPCRVAVTPTALRLLPASPWPSSGSCGSSPRRPPHRSLGCVPGRVVLAMSSPESPPPGPEPAEAPAAPRAAAVAEAADGGFELVPVAAGVGSRVCYYQCGRNVQHGSSYSGQEGGAVGSDSRAS